MVTLGKVKHKRGWFDFPGRPGDRKFGDQLMGLGPLFALCRGKTVLDVGCAEGLISLEMLNAGALNVRGVELVPERVAIAKRFAAKRGLTDSATFEAADLNRWRPGRRYDVVVGLSILHKLKDPSAVAARLAKVSHEWVVWRLPPENSPTIIDKRSGKVPHHIDRVMAAESFEPYSETFDGPFGEWVGYFKRRLG